MPCTPNITPDHLSYIFRIAMSDNLYRRLREAQKARAAEVGCYIPAYVIIVEALEKYLKTK